MDILHVQFLKQPSFMRIGGGILDIQDRTDFRKALAAIKKIGELQFPGG